MVCHGVPHCATRTSTQWLRSEDRQKREFINRGLIKYVRFGFSMGWGIEFVVSPRARQWQQKFHPIKKMWGMEFYRVHDFFYMAVGE